MQGKGRAPRLLRREIVVAEKQEHDGLAQGDQTYRGGNHQQQANAEAEQQRLFETPGITIAGML